MGVITTPNTNCFDNEMQKAGGKLLVFNFCADWCEQCETIPLFFNELTNANSDDVVFLKVDVGENCELVKRYGITKIPHFILLKDGNKIHDIASENKATLMEKIDEHK